MTKLGKLIPVVLTLLLIGGCNTMQTRSSDGSALARIEQRGELVLGTSGDMEPMSFTHADGKVVGLDVDIGRFMAQAMGVKLTTRTLPFTELLPALQRGEVDVVISNLTITPKRNMSVAFVGPYMTSGKCILTKQESLARAQQAEDLNTPDTRIAVMKGSTSEDFVRTLLPQATVMLTDNREAAVDLVKSRHRRQGVADQASIDGDQPVLLRQLAKRRQVRKMRHGVFTIPSGLQLFVRFVGQGPNSVGA